MDTDDIYKHLIKLLLEALKVSEQLNTDMLCKSFVRAITTNLKNSDTNQFSFSISDGKKYFSVEIKMNEDMEVIESMIACSQ